MANITFGIVLSGYVLLAVLSACLAQETASRPRPPEELSYLDNGTIRIAVDLNLGGVITYLSQSPAGMNIINSHDWGRQIQQSYYSGPDPFGQAHPGWKNWPWNPIGTGDVYGNPAKLLARQNDGKTLYVKSIPMHWALNNVPGECTFETWIGLEGKAAHVRCRLTNARPDHNQYPAKMQELPAVYTTGKLYKLMTYDGEAPFSSGPTRQVHKTGPSWSYWRATENWAALVNDDDWGLGVFHPGVFSFCGGFYGQPNTGGPKDNPTGYISPYRLDILDHNIVYEYSYVLILGSLDEIRQWVYAHHQECPPDYVFAKDRQHCFYKDASDAGWPLEGKLSIIPNGPSAAILGPETFFAAKDVPRLYVRLAYPAGPSKARLAWRKSGSTDFVEGIVFNVTPDGRFHTYELDLSASPDWQGNITQLRLDLLNAAAGDRVEVAYISHRKRD